MKKKIDRAPTMNDLVPADALDRPSDFLTDGTISYCQYCGAVKEASAKFFIDHYRDCVKPRLNERAT